MFVLTGRAGASVVSGHSVRSQGLLYLRGVALRKSKVDFLDGLGD